MSTLTLAELTNDEIVDRFLVRKGVTFTAAFSRTLHEGRWKGRAEYKCLFRQNGKQWTVRFHTITPPTAYDVLSCIASDYWIETNDEYEDLDYEPGPELEKLKADTARQTRRFVEFFDYETFKEIIDHLAGLDELYADEHRTALLAGKDKED